MRTHSKHRLLLVCGFVLAAMAVLVSQANATNATGRVRGTGNYGTLSSHQGGAPPAISGTGGNILSAVALYQCQYDGTPCPVDLTNTDPNLDAALSGSDSCLKLTSAVDSGDNPLTGSAPCYDLFITINKGVTFNPGSTLSILLSGFTDSGDQFGLFTCDSGLQGFDGLCTPTSNTAVTGCNSALATLGTITGQVNIPSACLGAGMTFFFDETANNSVSASYTPGVVAAPEPNSFLLLGVGLASLFLFSKRIRA